MTSYYGIGTGSALKVFKPSLYSLSHIGDPEILLSDVINQATPFMVACYGQSACSSKVSRSVACVTKL